jgi:hypothetical protein
MNLRALINEEINKILDKISSRGIDSLSTYEKDLLDRASAGEEIRPQRTQRDATQWLDDNFFNLEQSQKSDFICGKKVSWTTYYVVKTNESVFTIHKGDAHKVVFEDVVWDKLSEYFGLNDGEIENLLSLWLMDTHGIPNAQPHRIVKNRMKK